MNNLRLIARLDVKAPNLIKVPEGWQGAGNLTIFNNGRDRPAGPFSSVDEITPPLLPGRSGTYALDEGEPFGPAEPAWTAPLPPDRFAPFISGATRLRNGNTFVCAGTDGILLELTRAGSIVWEYRNPYSGDLWLADGSPPGPGIEDRCRRKYRERLAIDQTEQNLTLIFRAIIEQLRNRCFMDVLVNQTKQRQARLFTKLVEALDFRFADKIDVDRLCLAVSRAVRQCREDYILTSKIPRTKR